MEIVVKKLGAEWGAAHQEAQPHKVQYTDSNDILQEFTFYVMPGHFLRLEMPVEGKQLTVRGKTLIIDFEV